VIRYLLDTDIFSLYLRHHAAVLTAVVRHAADDLSLTVITVGELWDGWQAAIHRAKTPEQSGQAFDRLTETLNEIRHWPIVSFGAPAVRRYAGLKRQRLNVGANDLKIASIALETGSVVVTRNTGDFRRVPGLTLADWSV
jgi:tRNA(fMet)-specific endonuclease VapC